MKLTIKKSKLVDALNIVSKIANARAGLPILNNVLLQAHNSEVTLASTNLEITAITKISAKIKEEGDITVPAKLFSEFINSLPGDDVDISLSDNKLKIKSDKYKSTINTLDAKDYPALPEVNSDAKIVLKTDRLKSALNATMVSVGTDTSRPMTTGVYFYNSDGNLKAVATNGYRLSEYVIGKIDQDIKIIVPLATLHSVMRQIADQEEITINYSAEQVAFTTDNTTIISNVVDAEYADYSSILPKKINYKFSANRNDFIKAVRAAELFARSTTGSIMIEGGGKDSRTVQVRSLTTQLGDNTSDIDIVVEESNTDEFHTSINSRYLLDGLNNVPGTIVTITISDSIMPIILNGEDKDYLHLIMPLKTNAN